MVDISEESDMVRGRDKSIDFRRVNGLTVTGAAPIPDTELSINAIINYVPWIM